MSPPTATDSVPVQPQQTQEASANNAKIKMPFSQMKPPVFDDKYKEREYLKGRLAAAFRIFGKNGFDEGMPVYPLSFLHPFYIWRNYSQDI